MKKLLATTFLTLTLSMPVYSQDKHNHDHDHAHGAHHEKGFYGHLHGTIHADSLTDVASDGTYNEMYSHSHLEFGYGFTDQISMNGSLKLEGGADGEGHAHGSYLQPDGTDHGLSDHMLIAEQLTLNYNGETFAAYLGKFNPVVGIDYDQFPGMYGYTVGEEYQIKEMLGYGIILKQDLGNLGKHNLNFSQFNADNSFLSDSLLFQRTHRSSDDTALANTAEISSYAISLGGSDFYSLNNFLIEGLSYRIGYAELQQGPNQEADNSQYSAALMHKHELSKDLSSKIIFERVQIDNKSGEAAHDRSHTTGGLGLYYKQWNVGTTYTYTDNDNDEEADENFNGNIFQASVGYDYGGGIGVDVGYKKRDIDNSVSERIGLTLRFERDF
jgi:hypothetical protein